MATCSSVYRLTIVLERKMVVIMIIFNYGSSECSYDDDDDIVS